MNEPTLDKQIVYQVDVSMRSALRSTQPSIIVMEKAILASLTRLAAAEQRADTYFRAMQDKQAKIDALMLEFCPGEMSAEQRAEYARNQVPATAEERAVIDAALASKGGNGG